MAKKDSSKELVPFHHEMNVSVYAICRAVPELLGESIAFLNPCFSLGTGGFGLIERFVLLNLANKGK